MNKQMVTLIELNQKVIDSNLRQIADLERQIRAIKESNQKYQDQIQEFMKKL